MSSDRFCRVPAQALGNPALRRLELQVLMAICLHVNRTDGQTWVGQSRIAALTGFSPSKVSRAIAMLEHQGVIQKHRARFKNGRMGAISYQVRYEGPPVVQGGQVEPDTGHDGGEPVAHPGQVPVAQGGQEPLAQGGQHNSPIINSPDLTAQVATACDPAEAESAAPPRPKIADDDFWRLAGMAGGDPSKEPSWRLSDVNAWLAAGIPLATIEAVIQDCARRPGFKASSFRYFDKAIQEAHARGEAFRASTPEPGSADPGERLSYRMQAVVAKLMAGRPEELYPPATAAERAQAEALISRSRQSKPAQPQRGPISRVALYAQVAREIEADDGLIDWGRP